MPNHDDDLPPAADLPMTTDRLRWCLDILGWSQREAARMLQVNESTIRTMARGRRDIPDELATWLNTLAEFHVALGMPKGWKNTAFNDD